MSSEPQRRLSARRVLAYGLLPTLTVLLAGGAGFLKWQDLSVMPPDAAGPVVQAATDGAIALLGYGAGSAEPDLTSAAQRTTGEFREEYTALITDIVIPGAVEKQISSTASVPAAALVSMNREYAVVLVYVNQQTTIAGDTPTDSSSSVRVTLECVDGQWLIAGFEPV